MRILSRGFGIIVFWAMIGVFFGEGAADRFEIESKSVATRYSIEVVVPPGTPPPGTKYPVVYCMDWFMLGDYLKALPRLMELGRLAEPFILVGITQGATTDDWLVMRNRDFTPARPTDDYSKSNIYSKAMELTGGAAKFAAFLKEELIPSIESKYPADPARRCFVGYSLGGMLGVHLLTTDPELFQYYLLGSTSLWFNEYYLGPALAGQSPDRLRPVKKVYLSVGEEESWEQLKGFGMVRDALHEKGLEDARLKAEIIPASGHVGAMPTALYNGLRFLFRRK